MDSWRELIFSTTGIRWTCLAGAALFLAIATLILARFRVIQSRPLAACVVLSVFAHVLLFIAAYLVEFFELPEYSAGPTIGFHLVADPVPAGQSDVPEASTTEVDRDVAAMEPPEVPDPAAEPEQTDLADAPGSSAAEQAEETSDAESDPDLAADPQSTRPDVASAADAGLAETLEAPPLLSAEPSSTASTTPPTEPVSPDSTASTPDAPAQTAANLPHPEPPTDSPATVPANDSEPQWAVLKDREIDTAEPRERSRSTAPTGSLQASSPLGHRLTNDRQRFLQLYGGSADTERAVRDALRWLAHHQSADGRWRARDYGAGTASVVDWQDRAGVGVSADTGVTALAILAMFGAGETATTGAYQQELQRALTFLCRTQAPSGDLAGDADHYARMYCHGMSALALGEACSLHPQPEWENALRKALEFTRASQHRATGGWRYRPGDLGDTSQFGWQVMALVSGQYKGLAIPPTTRHGMEQFLRSVSSGESGGLAAYRHFMPPTPAMTAEALVCRLLLRPEVSPTVDEAVQFVLQNPPDGPVLNLYYCYYGSLALHLADASWDSWNHRLQGAVLPRQIRRGEHAGSWDVDTVWGRCGGRVYTTAIAALTLEVYYRYLPIVDRTLARR